MEKKDIPDRMPEAIARYSGITTNKLHELELEQSEFLHRKGHLLHHFIINKELETPILPKLVTSHGEEIVYYEALYDIVDYARVIEKLSKVADYEMIEGKKNAKGEVVQYNFDWLERGDSANLLDEELPTEGYGVSSFYIGGPGEEQYLLLGRVEVIPNWMTTIADGWICEYRL